MSPLNGTHINFVRFLDVNIAARVFNLTSAAACGVQQESYMVFALFALLVKFAVGRKRTSHPMIVQQAWIVP